MASPEQLAGMVDANGAETVALVTGATDGVGRELALALGRLGASVYAHGRSPEKVRSLEAELQKTSAAEVEVFQADFTALDAIRHLAASVEAETDHLDVLFNNAGAFFASGELTDIGVERTMTVNHLAPFVLTNELLPQLEQSQSRVVTTASAIHHRADFDIESFETVDGYDGMTAYANSKFANVLFTKALARRLDHATATCFHPGFIPGSGLYRHGSAPVRGFMTVLAALPRALTSRYVADSADGAAAALYLGLAEATAEHDGEYFDGMERKEPARRTQDEKLQERLWEWSEAVTRPDG